MTIFTERPGICRQCGSEMTMKTVFKKYCDKCKQVRAEDARRARNDIQHDLMALDDALAQSSVCHMCGVPVVQSAGKIRKRFCVPCAKIRKLDAQRAHPTGCVKFTDKIFCTSFIVAKDPDPEGGFPVGAQLDKDGVRHMLYMSHFTPGTILQKHDRKFSVYQAGYTQRLQEVTA